jgi:hypothetical protein
MLRIYNVPVFEEYEAPVELTLGVSKGAKSKFGVRVSRLSEPDNMRNEDLSTFSINTSGKTFAIQKVGTVRVDDAAGTPNEILHKLGTPPNFIVCFADKNKQYVGAINLNFTEFLVRADAQKVTLKGAQAALDTSAAYVILKEFAEAAI